MEAFTPAPCKTAKFHRKEYTPQLQKQDPSPHFRQAKKLEHKLFNDCKSTFKWSRMFTSNVVKISEQLIRIIMYCVIVKRITFGFFFRIIKTEKNKCRSPLYTENRPDITHCDTFFSVTNWMSSAYDSLLMVYLFTNHNSRVWLN